MNNSYAQVPNRTLLGVRAIRLGTWIEVALWSVAILVALAFVVIKVRAWGGVLDAPEQGDFVAVYNRAARVALLSPGDLYHDERWPQILGAGDNAPFTYPPSFAALLSPLAQLPLELSRRV